MNTNPDSDNLPLAVLRHIDAVCARFEAARSAGQSPRLEDYLAGVEEPARATLFRELLLSEREYCQEQGVTLAVSAYRQRFPEYEALILAIAEAGATIRHAPVGPTGKDQNSTLPVVSSESAQSIGNYTLVRELGRGGMGVVYLARDLQLNRMVALKLILAGAHVDSEVLARFHAEARAIAQLNHPNIVQIYDVGDHKGLPYIALEYVNGGSLAHRLAGNPQPPRVAARLVETIALAVQAAHAQGIVHRDLKPANILLSPLSQASGDSAEDEYLVSAFTPKITDFGLAKQLDPDIPDHPDLRTKTGAILGTPRYMAPEQARGANATIGPGADVYSLGVLLYELITGRPPFLAADLLELVELVCTQEPVRPSQLQARTPRDLQTICLKCLEKEPSRRYATALALAGDLRRFLDGVPIQARPVSRVERVWRWARRKPALAAMMAVSLILALTVVIGSGVAAVLLRIEHDNVVAERQRRQQRMVEAILNVNSAGVPLLLAELNEDRAVFLPLVQARWQGDSLEPNQRLRLAMALTSLGQPQTQELVRAVTTAPAGECANLVTAFGALPDGGTPVLRSAYERAEGHSRFRLAVLLLERGDPSAAQEMLAYSADPDQRTRFVHQFSGWHGDLSALPAVLRRHDDSALRSGLCAALGRLDPGLIAPRVAASLQDAFIELHQQARDPGTHAAAGWSLRRWGETRAFHPAPVRVPDRKLWYQTPEGLTMVRAEPPPGRFPWALWISDREVTREQFQRFLQDPEVAAVDKPAQWPGVDLHVSPTTDCPVHNVNLRDMMLFCNWLSRQAGRTPSYQPMPGQPDLWTCRFGANGYRLPTNAEWEYACRAGTTTRFYFGSDAALLPEYANVLLAHAEPGGRRLPNNWGLFDTLANEWEFCFDGPPVGGTFGVRSTLTIRGGTYGTGSFYSSAEFGSAAEGTVRSTTHGFRVVYREGQPADVVASQIGVEMLGRLIQQAPANRAYLQLRGDALLRLGRRVEAADDHAAALAPAPRDRTALVHCANMYVRCAQWRKALTYQARVAAAFPEEHALTFYLLPLLLASDDPSGYRDQRSKMLSRWQQTRSWQEAERTAKVCCLLELDEKERAIVLDLAQRAVRQVEAKRPPAPQFLAWCLLAEGMALYRCRRHEEAVERLLAVQKTAGMPADVRVITDLVQAMTLHRLGRPEEARAAFNRATAVKLPAEAEQQTAVAWNDLLMCRFLRTETELLLLPGK